MMGYVTLYNNVLWQYVYIIHITNCRTLNMEKIPIEAMPIDNISINICLKVITQSITTNEL